MPLYFTGASVPTDQGLAAKAHDAQTGTSIAVRISTEAIQDHGIDRARDVASDKYDAGQFEADGVSIFVRSADCE
jgi:hypothetical protein